MQIWLIFSLIISILAIIFAVQNNQQVTVSFLFWSFTGSSALIIILSVLTGVLISLLAGLPSMAKNSWNLRGHRTKISELETELSETNAKLDASEEKNTELEAALSDAISKPETDQPADDTPNASANAVN
jgi:uncharacterized integral membrane protein